MNRSQRRLALKQGGVAGPAPAVRELLMGAIRVHQAGQLEEAEQLYRRILAIDPRNAECFHRLGLIAYQIGRYDTAVELIGRAIAISPGAAAYHSNLGSALKAQDKLELAAASYRRALKLEPSDSVSHNNLGNVLKALGRLDLAVGSYEKALALKPDDAEVHNNLGNALFAQGKFEAATERYERALTLRPDYAEAHYNIANVLLEQKDAAGAVERFDQALALREDYPQARINLGNAYLELGERIKAAEQYSRVLEANPDDAEAANNLGNVRLALGALEDAGALYERAMALKPDYAEAMISLAIVRGRERRNVEATALLERALDLDPSSPEAHYNLGVAFAEQKRLAEAIAQYERTIELKPDHSAAWNCLGGAFQDQGKLDAALQYFDRALEADPNNNVAHSNLLFCMNYTERTAQEIFDRHRRWEDFHASDVPPPAPHPNVRDPGRRLRVGFVSADFKRHSVAWFLGPLIENLDRSEVEVFAYAEVPRPDEMTRWFERQVDQWRSTVEMSEDELATMVRADEIDILVDLAGHTGGNRLGMFARNPAPVQVTWLGYPNTTGLSAMHYRIIDAITDPEGAADAWASETLLRMDGGFLCFGPPTDAPDPSPPPCLTKGFVTFGSFNNPSKLCAATLDAWAQLVLRTPDSELLLKGGSYADASTRDIFHAEFARRGVESRRVRMVGQTPGRNDHLALYNDVDIALDPFPYNGTTTTCEAIWMGMPVIAMLGDRHAARVSASILTRVGLEALIAADPADYVRIACELAADPSRVARIKSSLRGTMAASSLCDAPAFARRMEQAYRRMWTAWCQKT